MLTLGAVEDQLKNLLLRVIKTEIDAAQIVPEVPLIKEGVSLDSVTLLEFVLGIEAEFNIMLDDGKLLPSHFASLRALAELVLCEVNRQSKHAG